MDKCGDNRFEIIEKAKQDLLESTNIDTSEDEMKVLESFLFCCWQMGWLDKYDVKKSTSEANCVIKDEDLEEAAKEYSFNIPTQLEFDSVWKKETEQHFKDGSYWKENQMKEALQTEYEKGRFDMKEEMMKALVNGEIAKDIHNQLKVTPEPLNDAFGKFGDKVKIIIVKED